MAHLAQDVDKPRLEGPVLDGEPAGQVVQHQGDAPLEVRDGELALGAAQLASGAGGATGRAGPRRSTAGPATAGGPTASRESRPGSGPRSPARPASLFIWRWSRSRRDWSDMSGHSAISASVWTTVKHGSRAGSCRRVTPRTVLVSVMPASYRLRRHGTPGGRRRASVTVASRSRRPACGRRVVQLQVGALPPYRIPLRAHAGVVRQHPIDDAHRRFVEQRRRSVPGSGGSAPRGRGGWRRRTRRSAAAVPLSPGKVRPGPLGSCRRGGRSKCSAGPEVGAALAQGVGMLGQVPEVPPEERLDLQLRAWSAPIAPASPSGTPICGGTSPRRPPGHEPTTPLSLQRACQQFGGRFG